MPFTSTPSLGSLSNNPTAVSAIWVNDKPTVSIANECNGVELMALFIGFILAYNGDWKLKTLYMIIGLISIYVINLIRIQLLIANSIYSQETLDFNHHYTFTIAVYACVFGMWMLWANKLSKIKFNPQKGKGGFVTTK